MRTTSLCAIAALTTPCFGATSITQLNARQSERILSVWSVYSATVAYDSGVASLVNAVYSIVPSSDIAHVTVTKTSSVDLVSYINDPPAITSPSWISDLPTSVANAYMALQTSVEDARVSLAREAVRGAIRQTGTSASSSSSSSSSSYSSSTTASSDTTTATTGASTTASSAAAASISSTATGGAARAPSGDAASRVAGMAVGAIGVAAFFI